MQNVMMSESELREYYNILLSKRKLQNCSNSDQKPDWRVEKRNT